MDFTPCLPKTSPDLISPRRHLVSPRSCRSSAVPVTANISLQRLPHYEKMMEMTWAKHRENHMKMMSASELGIRRFPNHHEIQLLQMSLDR